MGGPNLRASGAHARRDGARSLHGPPRRSLPHDPAGRWRRFRPQGRWNGGRPRFDHLFPSRKRDRRLTHGFGDRAVLRRCRRRRLRHGRRGRIGGAGVALGCGRDGCSRRWRRRRGAFWRRRNGLGLGRGKQAERVDVAVRIGGEPDAEVDVRRRRDGVDARADDADDRSFGDHAAARDARRAELQQRHRVAVRGQDRDRPTTARDRAGERDGACCRGDHLASELGADVDATMLPARIGVGAERERSQHRPRRRPDPGVRRRRRDERRKHDQERESSPHE